MGNTAKINLDKLRKVLLENGNSIYITIDEIMQEIIEKCVETSEEAVQHPKHYQGKHECIEVMRALFGDAAVMNFCKCNVFKYRFRASDKNGTEDIKKAEWYEEYLMKMQKGKNNDNWG